MARPTRLFVLVLACVALTTAVTAGLAAARHRPKPNPAVKIGTARVGKLGTVLVDGSGHVLYMFQPDKHARVACNSDCQSIWPPVVSPRRGVAKAIGRARQSLIGSYKNPAGHRIVTYNGWPLYTYVADGGPHEANGQNIDLNGGYWWVLTPNGHVEK